MKIFLVVFLISVVAFTHASPLLGAAVGQGAHLVGSALAGTVVADAYHTAGSDKVVNAATDWVNGAADTAKDWVGGAWESTKNFFG